MDDEDLGGYYSGDPLKASAAGVPAAVPSANGYYLPGDVSDAVQMEPFKAPPAQQQGAPWWAGLVMYGASKAIDNQFPGSPTGVLGNVYPGSGASWDGRTYTFNTGTGGVRPALQPGQIGGSARVAVRGDPTMLLLIGGAVLLLMLK